ncbi:MAG: substrate-binding domain-containing protein, partial [Limisphaerales bacterium]
AIQACNDMVAIGAANVFLKQGLKIPQDISIVGFGNILLSEYFAVPLTTVHQPKFRIGEAAMESMRRLLKRESVDSKRLPTNLQIRQSTAAPLAR